MMAYSEGMLSEEMEEAAKEDALRKYSYMVQESSNQHEFRSRVMTDGDYAGRRYRADDHGDLLFLKSLIFFIQSRENTGRFFGGGDCSGFDCIPEIPGRFPEDGTELPGEIAAV